MKPGGEKPKTPAASLAKNPGKHCVKPLAAGLCAVAAVVLAAALWYPPLWQTSGMARPFAPAFSVHDDRVHVNTALPEELALLPGIGQARAQAIAAHRESNGPFACLADLGAVPGIGPKTLAGLEDLVAFAP